MTIGILIGAQLLIAGAVLFLLGPRIRRGIPALAGTSLVLPVAAMTVGAVLIGIDVTGGQTPMSRTPNPIPNTVTSVTTGYRLYQANCAACHGVEGNGGGPLAGTTAVTPPSLKAHLGQHTDGDLFYWIANGLPGGMPAWSSTISETDRWNLINYLRSINGQGPTVAPSSSGAKAGPAATATRVARPAPVTTRTDEPLRLARD